MLCPRGTRYLPCSPRDGSATHLNRQSNPAPPGGPGTSALVNAAAARWQRTLPRPRAPPPTSGGRPLSKTRWAGKNGYSGGHFCHDTVMTLAVAEHRLRGYIRGGWAPPDRGGWEGQDAMVLEAPGGSGSGRVRPGTERNDVRRSRSSLEALECPGRVRPRPGSPRPEVVQGPARRRVRAFATPPTTSDRCATRASGKG